MSARKARGDRVSFRAWLDIDNPPQVQYLLPFRAAFERIGADVVVTARDDSFTHDLLRGGGAPFHPVGRTFGKATWRKVWGTRARARALAGLLRETDRPDVLVSASLSSALAARRLRIPAFSIFDYEHSHVAGYRFAQALILYPDVIRPDVFTRRGIHPAKLVPFAGIKEDLTFAGVDLESIPPYHLPTADHHLVRVLFRPPAEHSHYYRSESGRVALEVLERLSERSDLTVVYSPREPRQTSYLKRMQWRQAPVVLEKPAPFIPLLKAVDAVISSGGTMLREAAYVGVPAYSILRSEIGAVDRHLESLGRLTIISSLDRLGNVDFRTGGRQPPLRSNPNLLDEIVETVVGRITP